MAKRVLTSRDFPHRNDEDGKPLCRWCGIRVRPPRRSWCGDACVHEFNLRASVAYMRGHVRRRDKGVCNECGCDTQKLGAVLFAASNAFRELTKGLTLSRYDRHKYFCFQDEWLRRLRFNRDAALWQADHIVEVSNGGDTSMENIQTLCVPCHKTKTKQMHADRKFQRTGIKPKPPVREKQLAMI